MTTTILSTRVWGDTYAVRANWAQASDQVQALDADGDWVATGHQVADYRHSAEAALRAQLELSAIASGPFDETARAEIEAAMERATPQADA